MPITQKEFWVASDGKPYETEDLARAAEYEICKGAILSAYISKTGKSAQSATYARRVVEEFIDRLEERGFDLIEVMHRIES